MRAPIALTVLALLAASGVAVAGPFGLPDQEAITKPVEQSGSLASDTTLALLGSAADTVVDASGVFQAQFNGARTLTSGLFLQGQEEFAACPLGEGWQAMPIPSSIRLFAPDVPDVQGYAGDLAARAQAHPDIAVDQALCMQARLAPDLPALPQL